MALSIHIPGWLLWFAGGCVAGAVVMRVWIAAQTRMAIGRMFGW